MTVTAPETAVREAIRTALNAEFASDPVTFEDDKVHDSLGTAGPIGGVYPAFSQPALGVSIVGEYTVMVQLFHHWVPRVDPKQAVSPTSIETDAERIRRALREADLELPGDNHLWYFEVTRVEYPDDPAGNKTRLLATVLARAQNSNIVETTG